MPADGDPLTEVMVLGSYHFANPGRDLVNVETDDVLTPKRQAELEALAVAIAEWKPTKVLVEVQPDTADLHVESYRSKADELITIDRNEIYQIGYRLARKLDLADVYGFDEQPSAGEPDYFPMQSVVDWAAGNGREEDFAAILGQIQVSVSALSQDDKRCSIAFNLAQHNSAATQAQAQRNFYYGLLGFGTAEQQPGAELNAYWYMRNAKMFAKIDLIADPGDRVLVLVGAGHKYWLDHFAQLSPGYANVDPLPYLAKADDGRCN